MSRRVAVIPPASRLCGAAKRSGGHRTAAPYSLIFRNRQAELKPCARRASSRMRRESSISLSRTMSVQYLEQEFFADAIAD